MTVGGLAPHLDGARIARVEQQSATTQGSIDDGNARLAAIKTTVDELNTERDQLTKANATLRTCSTAARTAITAAQKQDKAAFEAVLGKFLTQCQR